MLSTVRKICKFTAKVLSILLLLLFIMICGLMILKIYETYHVTETKQQLTEVRQLTKQEEDWSRGMLGINEDYVGWLTVYGTDVNGPVVQGETNDTYLRTDIYKEHSEAGTMFMDEDIDTDADGNVIIYGHMMKDGSMFGTLKQYKKKSFFKENRIIRWEDKTGEHYYSIFAAMVINGTPGDERFVDLTQWAYNISEEKSADMLKVLEDKSYAFSPNMMRKADNKYIFLVTCDYSHKNDRLVLVGERCNF